MVAKKLNLQGMSISTNTVAKYVEEDGVETEYLNANIAALINFYGLDWRNPEVVELFFKEEKAEDSPLGQRKTLLATA